MGEGCFIGVGEGCFIGVGERVFHEGGIVDD